MTNRLATTLGDILESRLLKYATGQAIFCARCETVLDCEDAVLVEGVKMRVLCGECWDHILGVMVAKRDPDPYGIHGIEYDGIRQQLEIDRIFNVLDVIDGRLCDWEGEQSCPQ